MDTWLIFDKDDIVVVIEIGPYSGQFGRMEADDWITGWLKAWLTMKDLYIICYMCDSIAYIAKVIDYFGLRTLVNVLGCWDI